MAKELAFVLINPYTIAKSRTGGVIARFISRSDLDFVAARMFGPSMELVEKYSELVRNATSDHPETCALIADYILSAYAPDASTGRPRRVLLLLFEGEDAVRKIWNITGSATLRGGSGETVRDTYGDFVLDDEKKVQYFEPAVLIAPTRERVVGTLKLWAQYSSSDGGVIESAIDVARGEKVEKTLVLIKPDNFRFPSAKPGNMIDLFSISGLRIVGVKKFNMTVAQAEKFYGPVREILKDSFKSMGTRRAADALTREFGFDVPEGAIGPLCAELGPLFAHAQFEAIVKYMTGRNPSECSALAKSAPGLEGCLALVYEGIDAVAKIRSALGSTDPTKARPGSVRREFGSNIMVNAAHASDCHENAMREIQIIAIEEYTIRKFTDLYYGNFLSRIAVWRPRMRRILRKLMSKPQILSPRG